MAVRSWQLTLIKVYTILVLVSIAATVIMAAQDHDVPVSVDGMRCDSCGRECSAMCGSRSFRTCCYNYIKKRSIPWTSSPGGGNGGVTSDNQDSDAIESQTAGPISGSDLKTSNSVISSSNPVKTPILMKGVTGKHFLRGYAPEIIGGGDSVEEEEFIYPLNLRDLVTNVIRNFNAFANKKHARTLLY